MNDEQRYKAQWLRHELDLVGMGMSDSEILEGARGTLTEWRFDVSLALRKLRLELREAFRWLRLGKRGG